MRPLAEQVILVTGATDGLGRYLVGELAAAGTTVVVHGRSAAKLGGICAKLVDRADDARIGTVLANLADLRQVDPVGASPVAEGGTATLRLIIDPELDGVTGQYFHVLRQARADDQAYDPRARARLRAVTEDLVRSALTPMQRE